MLRHHRLRLVLPLLGVLVLAGCTDDTAEVVEPTGPTSTTATPQPTATSTPTAPPESTATPTPTVTPGSTSPDGQVPTLSTRCELPADGAAADRVEFAAPAGWQVQEGSCEFLDPSLDELEQGTEPDAALNVRVADADFATVAGTEEIDGEIRWIGARSGYQAVRIRGEAAGQGLRPQGEPVQLWLVDLDAGTDEEGGTLVLSAGPSSGAGFALAAEAADRIADTLRVVPPAAEDAPVVVTRTEGGGAPWTVTLDRDAGCFQLRRGSPTDEVVDEACEVGAPDDTVTGAILSDGDLQVVAGLAPPLATLVESDAATAPYGGVTTGLEGAAAFAYRAITGPLDVRAVDASGDTIATATIG